MFKKYMLIDQLLEFPSVFEAAQIAEIDNEIGHDVVLIGHHCGDITDYESVSTQWVQFYQPEVGGYFIKELESGGLAYVPADLFQRLYTLVDNEEINGDINAEIEEMGEGTIDNGVVDYDEPELESFSDFINKLSAEIHTDNIKAGWWNNPEQCLFEKLQLVNTEIAEGTEGLRKDLKDDKLPHRMMEEVELADAIIRLLDLGGYLGLDYDENATGDLKSFEEITSEAGQHFICTRAVIYLGTAIQFQDELKVVNLCYSEAINYLLHVGKLRGYEVLAALQEKCEFNKTRKDHTREARAAENGKKF